MTFRIRTLAEPDLPAVIDLNNAAYPAVPVAAPDEMAKLVGMSNPALVVTHGNAVVGFLLAIEPGADYDSENYRFFAARGTDSLYVDRIVIADGWRGRGLGGLLYGEVFARARAAARAEVTCEVNVDPPNPVSLAFHNRLGFAEVGRQATKGGTITVALLAAPVLGAGRG